MLLLSEWVKGAGDEVEKGGDKPPKAGKGRTGKKPKEQKANPDFDDLPGYGGLAFGQDSNVICVAF